MLAGLLAVLLVCGPLLAVAAFRLAERAGLRQQHKQRAWRQVTASLLRPRSGDVMALDGAWAPARWTAPGRAGSNRRRPGARPGLGQPHRLDVGRPPGPAHRPAAVGPAASEPGHRRRDARGCCPGPAAVRARPAGALPDRPTAAS